MIFTFVSNPYNVVKGDVIDSSVVGSVSAEEEAAAAREREVRLEVSKSIPPRSPSDTRRMDSTGKKARWLGRGVAEVPIGEAT